YGTHLCLLAFPTRRSSDLFCWSRRLVIRPSALSIAATGYDLRGQRFQPWIWCKPLNGKGKGFILGLSHEGLRMACNSELGMLGGPANGGNVCRGQRGVGRPGIAPTCTTKAR